MKLLANRLLYSTSVKPKPVKILHTKGNDIYFNLALE
jgi:hypothetical protein